MSFGVVILVFIKIPYISEVVAFGEPQIYLAALEIQHFPARLEKRHLPFAGQLVQVFQ